MKTTDLRINSTPSSSDNDTIIGQTTDFETQDSSDEDGAASGVSEIKSSLTSAAIDGRLDTEVQKVVKSLAKVDEKNIIRVDSRKTYVAGLHRLWKSSFDQIFFDLPKTSLLHQKDCAEKYWRRFMDIHDEAMSEQMSGEQYKINELMLDKMELMYNA